MIRATDSSTEKTSAQPIRINMQRCDCHKDLIDACRWARPVLEDAQNYITFMSRQMRETGTVEICREAKIVLIDNIKKSLEKIDMIFSELDEDYI